MNKKTILQVTIPKTPRDYFEYLPPSDEVFQQLDIGIRLTIPLKQKITCGVLTGKQTHTQLNLKQLKKAETIIDQHPILSEHTLSLCRWVARYYHASLGEVLALALPKLLRQGRMITDQVPAIRPQVKSEQGLDPDSNDGRGTFNLTNEQQHASQRILKAMNTFHCFLLDGVTGSGKTEVYLQCANSVINQGKQVLVLVPEIGLTPQIIKRFQQRFNQEIAIVHSRLTDRERLTAWILASNQQANIIIGTRSAVFTPTPRLGLIIIDEEHDVSFKQQEGLRYSARNVAIVKAQMMNIPIVLGSATPSLESLQHAKNDRYQWLKLTQRVSTSEQIKYCVIDLRKQKLIGGLSNFLLELISQHLAQGNQVLLFINRRGFAPVLMCHACAWTAQCPHCDTHLTLHHSPKFLQCHHCGVAEKPFIKCPECGEQALHPIGIGTERLEQTLQQQFPEKNVVRIDRDSTRNKQALPNMLADINSGKAHILIGTQMLAKGHHFPNVTLVGILNADDGLFSTDFRASERFGQLLLQVAGRAGRAEKPGEVLIQTHVPNDPRLKLLLQQSYYEFAQQLLKERQTTHLPPFAYLALLRSAAKNNQMAFDFLIKLKKQLTEHCSQAIQLLGPVIAPMPKRGGYYQYQLLLQSDKRPALQQSVSWVKQCIEKLKPSTQIRWSLDIDPIETN